MENNLLTSPHKKGGCSGQQRIRPVAETCASDVEDRGTNPCCIYFSMAQITMMDRTFQKVYSRQKEVAPLGSDTSQSSHRRAILSTNLHLALCHP